MDKNEIIIPLDCLCFPKKYMKIRFLKKNYQGFSYIMN